MIELKLSTVSASILLATSRYFADLAEAVEGAPLLHATVDVETFPGSECAAPSNFLPLPLVNAEPDEEEEEAPAPPTVGAPAGLAAAGVDLDSEGYPWDHRIHSTTKSMIANGTWKIKRGIDSTLIDSVRAEFDRAASIPAGTICAPLPPQAAAIEPAPTQPAPTPTPPTIIAPAPANTGKPTNPAILFSTTLQLYARAVSAGKVAEGSGEVWAKQVGLPSLATLITRPDLCGQFYDQLSGLLA
jgi:hypothetical protein